MVDVNVTSAKQFWLSRKKNLHRYPCTKVFSWSNNICIYCYINHIFKHTFVPLYAWWHSKIWLFNNSQIIKTLFRNVNFSQSIGWVWIDIELCMWYHFKDKNPEIMFGYIGTLYFIYLKSYESQKRQKSCILGAGYR